VAAEFTYYRIIEILFAGGILDVFFIAFQTSRLSDILSCQAGAW